MKIESLQIVSDGLTLQGVFQTPAHDSWPLVVLCHGFLSYKDSSKYRELGRVFAEAGIATIRFDFRGCGESDGLLAESTVSGRWRDLQQVITRIESLAGFNGSLGLLGSSLGGYLALLEASHNSMVRCLAVWSTPSHLGGLEKRLPDAAPVPMSPLFYEDLRRQDLLSRLSKVQRVLIVHGEQDELVPADHASSLFAAVQEPKSLHILSEADHRFNQTQAREQAVNLSLAWFQRFL